MSWKKCLYDELNGRSEGIHIASIQFWSHSCWASRCVCMYRYTCVYVYTSRCEFTWIPSIQNLGRICPDRWGTNADEYIKCADHCLQDPGSRILDTGPWTQDAAWIWDTVPRILDHESRILDPGFCIMDRGDRVQDLESGMQDPEFRILDPRTMIKLVTVNRHKVL